MEVLCMDRYVLMMEVAGIMMKLRIILPALTIGPVYWQALEDSHLLAKKYGS